MFIFGIEMRIANVQKLKRHTQHEHKMKGEKKKRETMKSKTRVKTGKTIQSDKAN